MTSTQRQLLYGVLLVVGVLSTGYYGILFINQDLFPDMEIESCELFRVTPQDLLIAFFALALPNLPVEALPDLDIGPAVFRALVLFYAIEFVLSRSDSQPKLLLVSSIISLALFSVRGLF